MQKVIKKIKGLYSSIFFYGTINALSFALRDLVYTVSKRVLHKKMIKRKIYNFKMYLSLMTEGISRELYLYGSREEDHKEIFLNELKSGNKVLDIGSNLGYYALMEAMLVGEEGKVFAVEPDPRNLEMLTANISLNKLNTRIQIFNVAISNKSGIKDLAVHTKSNRNVLLSTGEDVGKDKYLNILKVKTIDIYDFLQTTGKVNLIRMDIEGHEVEVLEGIVRLSKNKPHLLPDKILFEVHTWIYDKTHHNMREKLLELLSNDYSVKTIASSDERSSLVITDLGYTPWKLVDSDFKRRALYSNIRRDDALKFICDIGCIRTVLLSRNDNRNAQN